MELDTGDLLLCKGDGWVSRIISFFGHSKYTHVGIILKNPKFLCETLEDGLYVWDSSYSYTPEEENKEIRYGVQIHKLKDIMALYSPGTLFVRQIKADRDETFYNTLRMIHKEVHAKPYDLHIMDWIYAKENMERPLPISSLWKHTDRFWCSAFVSYLYVKLGWVSDVNWSLVAPREFSSTDSTGQLLFTCIITEEKSL